jgi:hypothetical protein
MELCIQWIGMSEKKNNIYLVCQWNRKKKKIERIFNLKLIAERQ